MGDSEELSMATFKYDREIPVPAHLISYVDLAVKRSTVSLVQAFNGLLGHLTGFGPTDLLADVLLLPSVLPPGTNFHGISAGGESFWARTAKIDATDQYGELTPYFIKVHAFCLDYWHSLV